jgi:hypothetical protein
MSGKGVLDAEFFQVFRIVGEIVHKGFDQETVFDDDFFIVMQGNAETFVVEMGSFAFEFIATDVGLVDKGMLHCASAQKIAAREAGILECEMQGKVRGEPVKCVELGKFFLRNQFKGIGAAIHFGAA